VFPGRKPVRDMYIVHCTECELCIWIIGSLYITILTGLFRINKCGHDYFLLLSTIFNKQVLLLWSLTTFFKKIFHFSHFYVSYDSYPIMAIGRPVDLNDFYCMIETTKLKNMHVKTQLSLVILGNGQTSTFRILSTILASKGWQSKVPGLNTVH